MASRQTIQCGVTVAIPAAELQGLLPADVITLADRASAYLTEELKRHTKGARPVSDLRFQVQDSVDDPLQGPIVPMTLQGDFRLEDLATDSTAYQAHLKERTP